VGYMINIGSGAKLALEMYARSNFRTPEGRHLYFAAVLFPPDV